MEGILENITVEDLKKIKLIMSLVNTTEKTEMGERITLRSFADEYENFIQQNRSASYLRSVKLTLKHFEKFIGPKRFIDSILLRDVENFITYLQQNIKSASKLLSQSKNGYVVYHRNLKAAFNKAKEWGYVKENYFIKVKLQKKQKIAPAYVNSNQLSAIGDQLKNDMVKNAVEFAFYTGLRLSEITNLRWKNVDLLSRVIIVGDEEFITKGRTQRFVPICEETAKIIETLRPCSVPDLEFRIRQKDGGQVENERKIMQAKTGFVFCKEDGGKISGNYLSRKFKDACKDAGIDDTIHFHSLRHSFASNLVQNGVPLYTVKELLGHSSVSTTEIYSHLNMDTLREAVEKLDTPKQPTPFVPLPGGEIRTVKIYRINSGVMK